MSIECRAAHRALHPFVIGFVERPGAIVAGASLQLPFAIPVIHIVLDEAVGPGVAVSGGTKLARTMAARSLPHSFVIALGFGGVALLWPGPASAAVGGFVEVEDTFWRALRQRTRDAPDFATRVAIAEHMLMSRIGAQGVVSSPLFKAADAIAHDRWSGPIRELARHCGIEERTLRNRFRHDLGWSPKRLLRVARFNRALRTLHPRPWSGRPMREVRLEFFDDAHFYREFRAHAGISPAAFVAAKQRSGDAMLHNLALQAGTSTPSPS